jgi:hypothetical protein
MKLIIDHRSLEDKETTLYAVVSNPIDAHTVLPKYGFAGDPVPPEYWVSSQARKRFTAPLMSWCRRRGVK